MARGILADTLKGIRKTLFWLVFTVVFVIWIMLMGFDMSLFGVEEEQNHFNTSSVLPSSESVPSLLPSFTETSMGSGITFHDCDNSSFLPSSPSILFFSETANISTSQQFFAISSQLVLSTFDQVDPNTNIYTLKGFGCYRNEDISQNTSSFHCRCNLTFSMTCSSSNTPCSEFDFLYIKNTFPQRLSFHFFFDGQNITSIHTFTRYSSSLVSYFKTSIVVLLDVISFLLLLLYLFLFLKQALFSKGLKWTTTTNLVMLVALTIANDPLAFLRFWMNANWLSYQENVLHFVFYLSFVLFLYAFIDQIRLDVFEKNGFVFKFLERFILMLCFIVFYFCFFGLYSVPQDETYFANITPTMQTGLVFSTLSNFVLLVTLFEIIVDLINIYSSIHTPFQLTRYVPFLVITFIFIFGTIFNLLSSINYFQLPPFTQINQRFITTAYVVIMTVYFFPVEISNDDEYGMVKYIEF